MTRKKVRYEWIVNDNARKASLKKRRQGITKKVSELSTLCDVDACLVIYSPDEVEPLVWPSPDKAHKLIERFYSFPEFERSKKAMTQESYLTEKLGKVHEQLKKNQQKNKEIEIDYLMRRLQDDGALCYLRLNEMYNLAWFCREKMKEIRKRLEFFQYLPLPELPTEFPGEEPPQSTPVQNSVRHMENDNDNYMMDQWFFTETSMDIDVDDDNNNNNGAIGVGIENPSAGMVHNYELSLNMPSFDMNMNPICQNQRDMSLYDQYGNFLSGQNCGSDLMRTAVLNSHSNHSGNSNNLWLGLHTEEKINTDETVVNNNSSNIAGGDLDGSREGVMVGQQLGLLLHGTGCEVEPGILGSQPQEGIGVNAGPSHQGIPSCGQGENDPSLPFGLYGVVSGPTDSLSCDVSKGWPHKNNSAP